MIRRYNLKAPKWELFVLLKHVRANVIYILHIGVGDELFRQLLVSRIII